jgi:hypothetical protein
MRKTSLIILFVVGCAHQPKKIYLSDGSQGFLARCDGAGETDHTCIMKAGETCGKYGYRVVSSKKERSRLGLGLGGAGASSKGAGAGAFSISKAQVARSLVFRCGKNRQQERAWSRNKKQEKRNALAEEKRREKQIAEQQLTPLTVLGILGAFIVTSSLLLSL